MKKQILAASVGAVALAGLAWAAAGGIGNGNGGGFVLLPASQGGGQAAAPAAMASPAAASGEFQLAADGRLAQALVGLRGEVRKLERYGVHGAGLLDPPRSMRWCARGRQQIPMLVKSG